MQVSASADSGGDRLPLLHRHPPPVPLPHVLRLRPDQPAVAQLLQAVRRPAGDAADGEGRREQLGRQPQAVQQQRGVELDVGVQAAVRLALAEQAQGRGLDRAGELVERPVAAAARRTAPPPRPGRRPADRAPGRRGGRSPSAARRGRASRGCTASARSGVPISKTMSSAGPGRAAVQRPFKRPDGAGDGRDQVRSGGDDHPGGEGRGVEAVVGHRVEIGLQPARPLRRRLLAGQHVEEVRRVPEILAGRQRLLAPQQPPVGGHDRGEGGDQEERRPPSGLPPPRRRG